MMPIARHSRTPNPRRGLTLIECVLAVAIAATMVTSALLATGSVAKTRLVQKDQTNGMSLARQLMSEIMQSSYSNPDGTSSFGPESGETRASFDDVDDYDGLHEAPPQDHSGTALSGFSGWQRDTTVTYLDQGLLGTILSTDSGLKKVTVMVTSPAGVKTTLCALRSSSSEYEKVATSQRTYIGQSVVTLQVGSSSSAKVVTGVNPVNQVP